MSVFAGEMARAAGVGGVFLLIFASAELWKHTGSPSPEWTRKAVHLGGGTVSLAFPWVFHSHWTVLALGILFAGVIVLSRRMGTLGSIHGVNRNSEGGIYFPIAIYLVFLIGHERPVFYLIAVLALVLSDALAALIGTVYGRTAYAVEGDRRSVEGSAVFFLATFLCVHLPLLLLTDLDRAASVAVAVQIALVVTCFEAISVRGADNLVIPVGTYLLLLKMTPLSGSQVALQLASQLVIIAALVLLVWRSRFLTASGTIAASLFFYGAWSLGGAEWIVPPILGLAALWVIMKRFGSHAPRPDARYQVLAVFYTAAVACGWFIANNVFEMAAGDRATGAGDPFYALYLGTLAAHLALLALVFLENTPWPAAPRPARLIAGFITGYLVVVPMGLWIGSIESLRWSALVAAGVCAGALVLYPLIPRWSPWPRDHPWDARLQALCAGLASVALLPLQLSAVW